MNCYPERSRWESEANPPAESKDPYSPIRIRSVSLTPGSPIQARFWVEWGSCRHNNIADHDKTTAPTCLFENHEEPITSPRGAEKRQSPIARPGDKVQMVRAIGSMRSAGHE